MSKKNELNEEDKELFRNAVKDVKPIKQDKHIPPPQTSKFKTQKITNSQSSNDFRFLGEILLDQISFDEWLTPENSIHFTQGELSRRTLKQLKNGQIPINAKLDLHGFTRDEAVNALTQCFSRMHANGDRVLLVIHGKSRLPGQHGPILKNLVYLWLKNQPDVLAVQSAHAKHGGNGAVYVLLRRHKK